MNYATAKDDTDSNKHTQILIVGSGFSFIEAAAGLLNAKKAFSASCVTATEAVENLNNAFCQFELINKNDFLEDPWSMDFEDNGPDFDIRSWAFIKKQTLRSNRKNRFKKSAFSNKKNNKLKLFKLKSMDSRSGYRGIKRIKRS